MAVYVTKNMLTKLGKVKYPVHTFRDNDDCGSQDHWQRLFQEGNKTIPLSKDMICRVCAKYGNISMMEKIDGLDIMGAVKSITNVAMQQDDSLPKYICSNCLDVLKMAMSFKRNCEISDKRFKKILNPQGDPYFYSYPYSRHDFQLILHQIKQRRMKIEERQERERQKKEKVLSKKTFLKTKLVFKCSPCDITFSSKEKLRAHKRERQCMRRACELCGQLVLSIAQHMRHIHKQNPAHQCPTCGKEFPVIARLRNHMLVHTNNFNFFCDLCPYKSKHKYYLVMHMRTHTGEKPYKCQLCPATFVNPSNLNKHKLTHQEKQFKCVCEKTFRTSGALREHHEVVHMNIKHPCRYCPRDFCYKSDLRKHEIKYHNRTKRDYIGGEPTYKKVERMQKLQQEPTEVEVEKWPQDQQPIIVATYPIVQTYTIEENKEFIQTSQPLYFSSEAVIHQTQTQVTQVTQQIIQPQTVQLSLPELTMKKDDDDKLYETGQQIQYF